MSKAKKPKNVSIVQILDESLRLSAARELERIVDDIYYDPGFLAWWDKFDRPVEHGLA